jgi:hypothetical protein
VEDAKLVLPGERAGALGPHLRRHRAAYASSAAVTR